MKTISDLPSASDIERLERALAHQPLDSNELVEAIVRIGGALREHATQLGLAGGPLTRQEEIGRPSLARRAGHLPQQIISLAEQSDELEELLSAGDDSSRLRQRMEEFLRELGKLRNEEADVKYESVETDIGSAD